MAADDLTILLCVLGLRLLVPLAILRYPFPAILASLVLDAADQTIFQQATDIDLEELNYQGYDKALDIYYLTIAYLSTYRNWRSIAALWVATGLWYYRLVGVTLFELIEWRPLLLIFPNTFEYFFIFIAGVRLRYDTDRLSSRQIVLAAAAIWVFIKLPQEYWIHVAQLDTTDVLKEHVFGVDPSDSWGTAFANRPLVTAAIIVAIAGVLWLLGRLWRAAPPPDHSLSFDADRLPRPSPLAVDEPRQWHEGLAEKVVLLGLVTIIFANALLGTDASAAEIAVQVAIVVTANAALSQFLTTRRGPWRSTGRAFIGTVAINAGLLLAFRVVFADDGEATFYRTAFLLFLISLIISLYDRYRPPLRRQAVVAGFAATRIGRE